MDNNIESALYRSGKNIKWTKELLTSGSNLPDFVANFCLDTHKFVKENIKVLVSADQEKFIKAQSSVSKVCFDTKKITMNVKSMVSLASG